MRLLLDENLSESVLPALADLYPDSLHVRLLGAGGASDERVWQLAKEHGCILVTRDEDFLRLSIVRGAPPKIVWFALGKLFQPRGHSLDESTPSSYRRVRRTRASYLLNAPLLEICMDIGAHAASAH